MVKLNKQIETEILDIILLALKEDIGTGDITTDQIIPSNKTAKAKIIAKQDGIICGLSVAEVILKEVDKTLKFKAKINDGLFVKKGKVIAEVSGKARSILMAERTVLNFLQKLSGISTITRAYVDKIKGTKTTILDTRKTSPGLRALEKYAVKVGGGTNHRIGLFDAILIKDNHIKVVGSVKKSIELAKKKYKFVEVETETIAQIKEAINAGATWIMLDNMNIKTMKEAVKLIRSADIKIKIEASGGVTLNNIRDIAKTGVDYISIGALTHSSPALDISLKV